MKIFPMPMFFKSNTSFNIDYEAPVPFSPDCYITYRVTAGVSSLFRITETGFSA